MHLSKKTACSLILASSLFATCVSAQLPKDEVVGKTTLPPPNDHRSYIVDFEFDNLVVGRVVVVDPDEQEFLGIMPTGGGAPMVLSEDRETIYTADFFYSRYVRGERVDVVTAWDSRNLEPKWELEIPSKRAFILTERYGFDRSADDKFLYIYNFTPSTSITVVDVTKQEVVNEISINGCILSYPSGDRQFASICGDGTLQTITLDDKGQEIDRAKTKFFDPDEEKLVERATQVGEVFYFVTTLGEVVPMDMSGKIPAILPRWSLVSEEEKEQGWAPGGWQLMAASPALNRLYVLMHPDHKPLNWQDPSQTIWVFDLETGEKIDTLESPGYIWSMSATKDDNPLLLGVNIEGGLEIFDLNKGEHKGTMDGLSKTPTLVINH
ncbi:MAG: amine dehydrogenase large subunit [Marinobacter sp.]